MKALMIGLIALLFVMLTLTIVYAFVGEQMITSALAIGTTCTAVLVGVGIADNYPLGKGDE